MASSTSRSGVTLEGARDATSLKCRSSGRGLNVRVAARAEASTCVLQFGSKPQRAYCSSGRSLNVRIAVRVEASTCVWQFGPKPQRACCSSGQSLNVRVAVRAEASTCVGGRGEKKGEREKTKRKEKKKSLVLSAKRYSIFPLVPCIDSLGFPYPASWGRAF